MQAGPRKQASKKEGITKQVPFSYVVLYSFDSQAVKKNASIVLNSSLVLDQEMGVLGGGQGGSSCRHIE
jgi:hypothetical protein